LHPPQYLIPISIAKSFPAYRRTTPAESEIPSAGVARLKKDGKF
jgi:hypothetical protein